MHGAILLYYLIFDQAIEANLWIRINTRLLMIEPKPILLTGLYVQLEPIQEKHYEILKALSQHEKISTYSPALKLKFDSWFNKALKKYPESRQISFIVRTLSDQKIVGSTRFYEIYLEHKRLAIGYTWYIPDVWGSTVNTESKLLLLEYAFETLLINRVEFFIDSRNDRSRAAVKKLGATEEGTLRQHIILDDDYIRDTVVYSILKNEWPTISTHLRKKLNEKLSNEQLIKKSTQMSEE